MDQDDSVQRTPHTIELSVQATSEEDFRATDLMVLWNIISRRGEFKQKS